MGFRAVFGVLLLAAVFSGCRHVAAPEDPNMIHVNGTVRFITVEGGFWAVRGDDNVTYDPIGGLAPAFQVEGLRVRLDAKRRDDMASVHMAGPIVEIISISRLPQQ
jgi:hypothetical protein